MRIPPDIIAFRQERHLMHPREQHLCLTFLEVNDIRRMANAIKQRRGMIPNDMLMVHAAIMIALCSTHMAHQERKRGRVLLSDSCRRLMLLSMSLLIETYANYTSNLDQIERIQNEYVNRFGLRESDFDPRNYVIEPKINRSFDEISDVRCLNLTRFTKTELRMLYPYLELPDSIPTNRGYTFTGEECVLISLTRLFGPYRTWDSLEFAFGGRWNGWKNLLAFFIEHIYNTIIDKTTGECLLPYTDDAEVDATIDKFCRKIWKKTKV